MIFMREPPPGVQPLTRRGLHQPGRAVHRPLMHEPGKPGCTVGLADLYTRLGKADRAATWLAAYDQIRNGNFHAPSPR